MAIVRQRWILVLVAVIATALLAPSAPENLLVASVPALWVLAYVAYRFDLLERRTLTAVERIEAAVAEHVDQGASDALMAIDKLSGQVPDSRRGGGLRSV